MAMYWYYPLFQLDGATYHSTLKTSAGGVGRNIAEGLSKLNGNVQLISKVGNDVVCMNEIFIIQYRHRHRRR